MSNRLQHACLLCQFVCHLTAYEFYGREVRGKQIQPEAEIRLKAILANPFHYFNIIFIKRESKHDANEK